MLRFFVSQSVRQAHSVNNNLSKKALEVLESIVSVGNAAEKIVKMSQQNSPTTQKNSNSLILSKPFFNFAKISPNSKSIQFSIPYEDLINLLKKTGEFLVNLINWTKTEIINLTKEHPIFVLLTAAVGSYVGFYYLGSCTLITKVAAPILKMLGIAEPSALSIGNEILGTNSSLFLLDAIVTVGKCFIQYIENDSLDESQVKLLKPLSSNSEIISLTMDSTIPIQSSTSLYLSLD